MSKCLLFFPFSLSRLPWLSLSNSPQLLHSTQVWWECMSRMCTWRNGCNEDTHASNLWNTGILKFEDQISHIRILIHGFISVYLYALHNANLYFIFFLQGTICNDALMTCCCGIFETCRMTREIRIRNGET